MLERIARRALKGPIYYIHYVSLVTYLMNRYFPLSRQRIKEAWTSRRRISEETRVHYAH